MGLQLQLTCLIPSGSALDEHRTETLSVKKMKDKQFNNSWTFSARSINHVIGFEKEDIFMHAGI